jgi:hypothetical protein
MAPEAEVGVAGDQHLIVHCSMRVVADGAAFAYGFVFENKRPTLRSMAFAACVVLGQQRSAAALHGWPFVWIVAIAATHFAAHHRMTVSQFELPFLVQMALEAGFWRSARVQDGIVRSATLIVNAPRAVARFASDILGIRSFSLNARVCRRLEIADNFCMALRAGLRSNKLRTRDLRWSKNRAVRGRTGDEANRPD